MCKPSRGLPSACLLGLVLESPLGAHPGSGTHTHTHSHTCTHTQDAGCPGRAHASTGTHTGVHTHPGCPAQGTRAHTHSHSCSHTPSTQDAQCRHVCPPTCAHVSRTTRDTPSLSPGPGPPLHAPSLLPCRLGPHAGANGNLSPLLRLQNHHCSEVHAGREVKCSSGHPWFAPGTCGL